MYLISTDDDHLIHNVTKKMKHETNTIKRAKTALIRRTDTANDDSFKVHDDSEKDVRDGSQQGYRRKQLIESEMKIADDRP